MNLTNQEVEFLFSWLDIPLHGEDLRARNKFISLIKTQHEKTQEARVKLLKELSEKDENGEPVIENGVYKLNEEGLNSFKKQFNLILEEGCQLYPTEDRQIATVLRKIKEILLNKLSKGLDIEEGRVYESILDELDVV